jgi:hypothetical protein
MGSRGKNSIVAGIAAGCILVCMAIVGPGASDDSRGSAANPESGRGPGRGLELEAPARQPVGPPATAVEPTAAAPKTAR